MRIAKNDGTLGLHCRGWFLNWTGMAALEFPWQQRKAALIVAHPGHELRVHHWMELARPLVLVLGKTRGFRLLARAQVHCSQVHDHRFTEH